MDRFAPPPPVPCPNPDCWAPPEATTVCRFCGTAKTGGAVNVAFRRILQGETT